MILKSIYIEIDESDLPKEYRYEFLKRSRQICNYLEREVLGKIKFDSNGFNRIVISLKNDPEPGVFINSEKVACVDLAFDRGLYDSKVRDTDLSRYYMDRLREGLQKCAKSIEIPKAELLAGMKSFEDGGMRNEWIHVSRAFKKHGLTAMLHCELTQTAFHLRLTVADGENQLMDHQVLETNPNELVFENRFKDIKIEGDELVVTSRIGPPLWSTPLAKLSKPAAKKSARG
jgi:hypothetical protein